MLNAPFFYEYLRLGQLSSAKSKIDNFIIEE